MRYLDHLRIRARHASIAFPILVATLAAAYSGSDGGSSPETRYRVVWLVDQLAPSAHLPGLEPDAMAPLGSTARPVPSRSRSFPLRPASSESSSVEGQRTFTLSPRFPASPWIFVSPIDGGVGGAASTSAPTLVRGLQTSHSVWEWRMEGKTGSRYYAQPAFPLADRDLVSAPMTIAPGTLLRVA